MKIKEWFDRPERWCRGIRWRNSFGEATENIEEINSMCLLGAVGQFYPNFDDYNRIREIVYKEINCHSISIWNDSHTFEEVKQLVEKLDI